MDHRRFPDRPSFDAALAARIDHHTPDLVVLAGFMRILGADFVNRYAGRLMNIHPSLLPAFTGLDTHRRALEAGCKIHGCTVHLVTPELDHGPIIAQAAVAVLDNDDENSLAARVLAQEHRLLPAAVRWYLARRLQVRDLRVDLAASPAPSGALRGARDRMKPLANLALLALLTGTAMAADEEAAHEAPVVAPSVNVVGRTLARVPDGTDARGDDHLGRSSRGHGGGGPRRVRTRP